MKTMNKTIKSVLAVAAVALLVGASVAPAFAAEEPKSPSGRGRIALEYLGAKVCRANQNDTQAFCAAGSGILYELCSFGTAAVVGKGSMAFDTVSSAQWLGGSPSFQTTYGISPIVYGTGNSGSSVGEWAVKCWKPSVPVRFENGLGIKGDDDSITTLAIYRLDSGINP